MNKGYWKKWMAAAGIRALKTMAQTAASVIATSSVMSEVNWVVAVSSAVVAGVLSVLTSVGGLPEIKEPKIEEDK